MHLSWQSYEIRVDDRPYVSADALLVVYNASANMFILVVLTNIVVQPCKDLYLIQIVTSVWLLHKLRESLFWVCDRIPLF